MGVNMSKNLHKGRMRAYTELVSEYECLEYYFDTILIEEK